MRPNRKIQIVDVVLGDRMLEIGQSSAELGAMMGAVVEQVQQDLPDPGMRRLAFLRRPQLDVSIEVILAQTFDISDGPSLFLCQETSECADIGNRLDFPQELLRDLATGDASPTPFGVGHVPNQIEDVAVADVDGAALLIGVQLTDATQDLLIGFVVVVQEGDQQGFGKHVQHSLSEAGQKAWLWSSALNERAGQTIFEADPAARERHGADALERHLIEATLIEHPQTAAQQHRHEIDMQFVDGSGT